LSRDKGAVKVRKKAIVPEPADEETGEKDLGMVVPVVFVAAIDKVRDSVEHFWEE
jgi:hypothetical protein